VSHPAGAAVIFVSFGACIAEGSLGFIFGDDINAVMSIMNAIMWLNACAAGAASDRSKGPKKGGEDHKQNKSKQHQRQRLRDSSWGHGAAAASGMCRIAIFDSSFRYDCIIESIARRQRLPSDHYSRASSCNCSPLQKLQEGIWEAMHLLPTSRK
jgi:hypothetical protein